jgi:hypothetical protein
VLEELVMTALGTVKEVQGKLLVFGRGLVDLLGCRVEIWIADAGFSAKAGDAIAEPVREEEEFRCGEENVAWLLVRMSFC